MVSLFQVQIWHLCPRMDPRQRHGLTRVSRVFGSGLFCSPNLSCVLFMPWCIRVIVPLPVRLRLAHRPLKPMARLPPRASPAPKGALFHIEGSGGCMSRSLHRSPGIAPSPPHLPADCMCLRGPGSSLACVGPYGPECVCLCSHSATRSAHRVRRRSS